MPPFNHLHPAIVHFPIALLTVAPAAFLLGALWPAQRRGLHTVALGLLILGLLGGLAALITGEAAQSFATRTQELRAALNAHETLAQRTVWIFGTLVLGWCLYMGISRFRPRELPQVLQRALFILWMVISAWGVATLLLTGHAGGRMVHELHTHGGEKP